MSFENTKKLKVPKAITGMSNDENSFRGSIVFWKKELKKHNTSIAEYERKAFTIDGVELGKREKLGREYAILTATFAFDSDLETDEYSDVNKMLRNLGDFIRNLEEDTIMYEAVRKLIVYLDMQIGCKLSFYSTFNEMLLSGELEYNYHDLKKLNLYNFKSLITFFYNKIYDKVHSNDNYIVSNNGKDKLEVSDWLNKKRISKIMKALEETKEIDIRKYYNFRDILDEIFEILRDEEISEKRILFIRKVLAYIEYSLGIEIVDSETIKLETIKAEIKSLRERTIFNEDIDMPYLKERFHYEDDLGKRKRG